MKRGTFFICNKKGHGRDVEISAQQVEGYIEGDVGVHRSGKSWTATHIPTGLLIIDFNTKKGAIEQAKRTCSAPGFETAVTTAKKSKYFRMFETAKKALNENK